MQFEIRNRWTNNTQFTAEIDCADATAFSLKMGLAVKWALKTGANLRDADLRDADLRDANLRDAYLRDAYLGGANLRGANLRDAYLGGANLRGANLRGAYLGGADLGGADLGGADLRDANLGGVNLGGVNLGGVDLGEQWIIQGPARSDGYFFMLTNFKDEGVRLKAGCRNFSLVQARKHWEATRKNTPLGNETFIILECLENMAIARGLKLDPPAADEKEAK